MASGWEQHVLVHMLGKVIFSVALRWRSSLPDSGSKRKTEKARCKRPLLMLVMRWHSFLLPSRTYLSSLSSTMHRSSMRRICSSS